MRSTLAMIIFSVLMLVPSSLGQTTATQQAGWREVQHEPTAIRLQIPPRCEIEDRSDEERNAFAVLNLDDAGTVFAVLRQEQQIGDVDPYEHARNQIEHHTASTVKSGGKVLLVDHAFVAGVKGRRTSLLIPADQFEMRVDIWCFVIDGREYKVTLAGQADFVAEVEASAGEIVRSMQPIEPARRE